MQKKERRGRPTSIRLFPETEKVLMRCPGKSMSDKFEYLVDFGRKREEMLDKVEKEYHERFRAYEAKINELEQLLYKLRNVTRNYEEILKDLKQISDEEVTNRNHQQAR